VKAIILAAGQGTRLRPYTDDRPKCMVPLAGRPLLHWQLDALKGAGIDDITVVGGYLADRLGGGGFSLAINPKYESTNMVSTLFCARKQMTSNEDVLICYGDIVYEGKILDAIQENSAEICLSADREWRKLWSMRMENPLSDAETFLMDANNKVLELGKKPRSYDDVQAQYMGLVRVRGDCINRFISAYDDIDREAMYDGKDFDNMYMTSFLQHLIDTGWDVEAALVDGGWLEVDTSEELEFYSENISNGKLSGIFNTDQVHG
jgi:choline kinase